MAAGSIRDALRNLADRFEQQADRHPDFRFYLPPRKFRKRAIVFPPVGVTDGTNRGQAVGTFSVLAIDALSLLTKTGVKVGNDNADELTRLVFWLEQANPSLFSELPIAEDATLQGMLTTRANPFFIAADALRKTAGSDLTGGKSRTRVNVKASVNARMMESIQRDTSTMGWNSRQWAEHLHCGKPAVVETETWQNLKNARQRLQADRMKDRHRKPKASDTRRDD